VGLGPLADSYFAVVTMLIAIPTGVKIFNWLATIWGGRIQFKTAMLFALGFISLFTMGGLSGFMHASPPADLQQTDTYFVVAHIHYVLFGGSMMGIFAGIYYWFPKMTGRLLHEGLGKLHFWLTVIAMNVTFFPMHFVGLLGMPRRVYTYAPGMGYDWMNQLSTLGAFGIAISDLMMGIFAGIYYWFPKMTGRLLHEGLGKLHFWLTVIAMNVTFFPMHFVGLLGMPRRVYTYAPGMGYDWMNQLSTLGAFGIAI